MLPSLLTNLKQYVNSATRQNQILELLCVNVTWAYSLCSREKEVWKGVKRMTGCRKPAPRVQGDPAVATELNLFFNSFDTTPTPVCSDSVSGSPPTISAPTHTSAVESALLPLMATSPSLSTSITPEDSPSSPLPNTYMSLDGAASPPPPPSMTCQPLLDLYNSLHATTSPPVPNLTPSQVDQELSRLQTTSVPARWFSKCVLGILQSSSTSSIVS